MHLSKEDREHIVEIFSSLDVQHGQFFDDGRRWCMMCKHPRGFSISHEHLSWKEKACLVCSAIWPEYIEEFIEEAIDQGEFDEEFPAISLN